MTRVNTAIIGQGFIGLPLALSFAMNGAKVYGVDVVKTLVDEINSGVSHHTESHNGKSISTIIQEQLAADNYKAITAIEDLPNDINAYIVTVGIPVKNGELEKGPITAVGNSIREKLKTTTVKKPVIILRSTVVPGYTESEFKALLELDGKQSGVDFELAYASERIAEGVAFEEFRTMPLAIGGVSRQAAEAAKEILTIVTKAEVTIASSPSVVELSKVIENAQRDVNIALSQQYAMLSRKMNIDPRELIAVANTHKRVNLLIPGPGVGGYCIPNAYHYLKPKAEELHLEEDMTLSAIARSYNESIPARLIAMLVEGLKEKGIEMKDAKIAILGLAMKDFSNDDRISPPIEIATELTNKAKVVAAYDPAVVTKYDYKVGTMEEALKGADAIITLCEQKGMREFDFASFFEKEGNMPFVLDTKRLISPNQYATVQIY